ncbi:MAG TPA: monodechloroaminopyrrolnitrin synthase PrnB family protein [Woeseiaceae bacterium]|nr:monodechloroaminopyrrolnitrin synthase PrnB family protein [Woeseiaceae bacterium]
MTENVAAFDQWIRGRFVALNDELEEIYFARGDRGVVPDAGADLRKQLLEEGHAFVVPLLEEGNTDEGFEAAFDLLGNVGMYMAACRRHEISEPPRKSVSPLKEASALAMHLGASLGVVPRFATSHLTTHNPARNGRYKTFTTLQDEALFLDYNSLAIFAYKRAADALVRILPLGISHPVTAALLRDASDALQDVARYNQALFDQLDTDRFFYCVRPYYKPYRVGHVEYRGANAGDFAGINEIDILLGLCSANDSFYSQLLVDKFLYMMPEDQSRLRDCMRCESLLKLFLSELDASASEAWFQRNARVFLSACEAHGRAAAQHHDQLVQKFIQAPSKALSEQSLQNVTASGVPLEVLLRSLEKLRDLRTAAPRDDIPSRYRDLERLRASLRAADGSTRQVEQENRNDRDRSHEP